MVLAGLLGKYSVLTSNTWCMWEHKYIETNVNKWHLFIHT